MMDGQGSTSENSPMYTSAGGLPSPAPGSGLVRVGAREDTWAGQSSDFFADELRFHKLNIPACVSETAR
jgi:hypothetical protein